MHVFKLKFGNGPAKLGRGVSEGKAFCKMPLTSRSAAQTAAAAHDASVREADEAHDRVMEFVRETATGLSLHLAVPGNRSKQADDHRVEESRQQQPETPRLELKRTEGYLQVKKEAKAGSSVPSYLKVEPGGKKPLTKRQQAALDAEAAKLTPEQIKAAVHVKTKALVIDAQHQTVAKAHALAQRHNALGIFQSDVNEARALSVCRRELRRSVSLNQLKQEAARLVAHGKPPRSEAAEAIASGAAIDLRTPDLLRGRLELLDEKFAEAERRRLLELKKKEQQGQQRGGRGRGGAGMRGLGAMGGSAKAAAPMALFGAAPSAARATGAAAALTKSHTAAGPAVAATLPPGAALAASVSLPAMGRERSL